MSTDINLQLHRTRRGVAPVIATLLLVAIAVVGGGIVFAYSQSFFSSSQISGKPTIEALKIIGYDGRATDVIQNQNGVDFGAASGGDGDTLMESGENVAVYIKNDSVQSVTLSELRFGGATYTFTSSPTLASLDALTGGQYTLASGSGATELITTNAAAVVQPGQTTSVVVSLSEDMKSGRDTQFKITTTNGAVFVGTVVIGQQSG